MAAAVLVTIPLLILVSGVPEYCRRVDRRRGERLINGLVPPVKGDPYELLALPVTNWNRFNKGMGPHPSLGSGPSST